MFFPVLFFSLFSSFFFHETNRNLREETNFSISQSPFRSSSKIQSRSLFRSFIHELFHTHNSMLARNKNNKVAKVSPHRKKLSPYFSFPFYPFFSIFPPSYFFHSFFLLFFEASFPAEGSRPLHPSSYRLRRSEKNATNEFERANDVRRSYKEISNYRE